MTHPTTAHWNREKTALSELKIPVEDRAFFFGDAIYEVIRVYHGKPWLFDEHMARLQRSVNKMHLNGVNLEHIASDSHESIAINGIVDGYVYLQVSRGTAPREHAFPRGVTPNVLIYAKPFAFDPWQKFRTSGIRVILEKEIRWLGRDIKTVNLLPNCLAKQKAQDVGAQEALFFEADGIVTEATSNNVFMVKDAVVYTHQADEHILHGISRAHTFDICRRLNIQVREQRFTVEQLLDADEAFVTGTTSEVLFINQIDNRTLPLGEDSLYHRIRKQFTLDLDLWVNG